MSKISTTGWVWQESYTPLSPKRRTSWGLVEGTGVTHWRQLLTAQSQFPFHGIWWWWCNKEHTGSVFRHGIQWRLILGPTHLRRIPDTLSLSDFPQVSFSQSPGLRNQLSLQSYHFSVLKNLILFLFCILWNADSWPLKPNSGDGAQSPWVILSTRSLSVHLGKAEMVILSAAVHPARPGTEWEVNISPVNEWLNEAGHVSKPDHQRASVPSVIICHPSSKQAARLLLKHLESILQVTPPTAHKLFLCHMFLKFEPQVFIPLTVTVLHPPMSLSYYMHMGQRYGTCRNCSPVCWVGWPQHFSGEIKLACSYPVDLRWKPLATTSLRWLQLCHSPSLCPLTPKRTVFPSDGFTCVSPPHTAAFVMASNVFLLSFSPCHFCFVTISPSFSELGIQEWLTTWIGFSKPHHTGAYDINPSVKQTPGTSTQLHLLLFLHLPTLFHSLSGFHMQRLLSLLAFPLWLRAGSILYVLCWV
jgi:hypothetical protein